MTVNHCNEYWKDNNLNTIMEIMLPHSSRNVIIFVSSANFVQTGN